MSLSNPHNHPLKKLRLKQVQELSQTDTAIKWKSWDNWGGLQGPLSFYCTANPGNSDHHVLSFARAVTRHTIPWKMLISLGNFQWIQKFVRRRSFSGGIREWGADGYAGRAVRRIFLPNSRVHSSVQLNDTKQKAVWPLGILMVLSLWRISVLYNRIGKHITERTATWWLILTRLYGWASLLSVSVWKIPGPFVNCKDCSQGGQLMMSPR